MLMLLMLMLLVLVLLMFMLLMLSFMPIVDVAALMMGGARDNTKR